MDPQQELFTEIRDILNRMYDGRVYDGFMPPEGTPYPFIYIADTRQDDVASKGAIFGYISVDLHIWHNDPMERGTVSEIALRIKQAMRKLESTANFGFSLSSMTQRLLHDDTTSQPLLHCILEFRFHFS